jgi:hypothetical protein
MICETCNHEVEETYKMKHILGFFFQGCLVCYHIFKRSGLIVRENNDIENGECKKCTH